jgi:anti-anti-sigma factor
LVHRFRKERAVVVALEDVQVTSPQAGVAVVSVVDELDLSARTEFSELLGALVRENELVVVDFTEALFVDSSTLNVLLAAHGLALGRGACLRLQLGDGCLVKRTFEISGLLEELSWASSREEALNGSAPATARDDPGSGVDRETETRAVDLAELDYEAWNLPRPVKVAQTSLQAPFSVQSGREDKSEPEPEAA